MILVGGRSSRMGRDKAAIPLGDRTLVEHVAAAVEPLVSRIVLAGGAAPDHGGLARGWVPDACPDAGPLAGIAAGLAAVERPWAFVLACDMPLVRPDVLRALLAGIAPGVEAVVPRHAGGTEPLQALYASQPAAAAARQLLDEGRRAAHRLQERLATVWVDDLDPRSFTNVNTPEDLSAL